MGVIMRVRLDDGREVDIIAISVSEVRAGTAACGYHCGLARCVDGKLETVTLEGAIEVPLVQRDPVLMPLGGYRRPAPTTMPGEPERR